MVAVRMTVNGSHLAQLAQLALNSSNLQLTRSDPAGRTIAHRELDWLTYARISSTPITTNCDRTPLRREMTLFSLRVSTSPRNKHSDMGRLSDGRRHRFHIPTARERSRERLQSTISLPRPQTTMPVPIALTRSIQFSQHISTPASSLPDNVTTIKVQFHHSL